MTRDRGIPAPEESSLAGSLLLAHPSLRDPNFRRSVILITAHGLTNGAMGVILNRPKPPVSAGEPATDGVPKNIPVYLGGPMEQDKIILAGWHMDAVQRRFQLHFGLDPETVDSVRAQHPHAQIRAFLGYAGWSAGQLEHELASPTWIISKIAPQSLLTLDGRELWRTLVRQAAPNLTLLAYSPDDPAFN